MEEECSIERRKCLTAQTEDVDKTIESKYGIA